MCHTNKQHTHFTKKNQIKYPDSFDFRADSATTAIPFPEMQFGQCRVLEFFSGGYGGWHLASKILGRFTDGAPRVVGIDNDMSACRTYCITNEVPLVSGEKPLPVGIIEQLGQDCVIHSDMNSHCWIPAVVHWRPQIACISAPCQPWSRAGLLQGLSSHNGIHFVEAILACRLIQPVIILIEQVAGFMSHPQRKWVIRTCTAAGYKLVWAKVIDLAVVCPTQRSRWIAIFQHASLADVRPEQVQLLVGGHLPSPVAFDAVLGTEQTQDVRTALTPAAFRILSCPEYLPSAKRQAISNTATPRQVLQERCNSVFAVAPTFLASYGSQHELDDSQLKEKGCLTHLVKEPSGRFRHWHPAEVYMMHLGYKQFFIGANWRNAYRCLGNQISIVHALFGLVSAVNFIFEGSTPIQLADVVDFAVQNLNTVSNSQICPFAFGCFFVKKDHTPLAIAEASNDAIKQLFALRDSPIPPDSRFAVSCRKQALSHQLPHFVSLA